MSPIGRNRRAASNGGAKDRVVLLGTHLTPADLEPVLDDVAPTGFVATIRAGWQEWEADPGPVSEALEDRTVPLLLHTRAERVWAEDPELLAAHRALQRSVRLIRRAYNARLSAAMGALDELTRLDDPQTTLAPERTAALDAIRELDEHQRRRIGALRAEFTASTGLADRPVVARERAEIAALVDDATAVVVEGGHVAVLLNRIRLFGVESRLRERPTVGISGGAMVLTDRLVLFHDSPPWGPGHAEVAEAGLGRAPGVAVFPHAGHRLRLDDPVRVGRLARRLAPAGCVLLEDAARLDWDGSRWSGDGVRRLTADGKVTAAVAA